MDETQKTDKETSLLQSKVISKEYYHYSGELFEIMYCSCGHSHLDHNMWGGGPCLKCECELFNEAI